MSLGLIVFFATIGCAGLILGCAYGIAVCVSETRRAEFERFRRDFRRVLERR